MRIKPEIVDTADGSQTLLHPTLNQHYHSLFSAHEESTLIFIESGLEYFVAQKQTPPSKVNIFEMGFGTGLNAYLTLKYFEESSLSHENLSVEYTSVELYPVSIECVAQMTLAADMDFMALHSSEWGEKCYIKPYFILNKLSEGLLTAEIPQGLDLVYFDAFSPDSQPELWSEEVFSKLYDAMNSGGVLTTYCCKGSVKRALKSAGFQIERLPGPSGKRHILRAVKL